MVASSNIDLSSGLNNGGVSLKAVYGTGYDQSILDNPAALSALNHLTEGEITRTTAIYDPAATLDPMDLLVIEVLVLARRHPGSIV